ncbi:MAG TPA: hypothetical protein VGY55_00455 [Pirellulales bacterium]|jgi:hypothetical protein|nr:hypothetical protein [Pirellulales bacterium]
MDDRENPPEQQSPIAAAESLSAGRPPKSRGDSIFRRQRRQLREYRRQALNNPNHLAAGLAYVTADLLELEMLVARVLRRDLRVDSSVEDVEQRSASIGQVIGLSKQAAQLSKLQMQLTRVIEDE